MVVSIAGKDPPQVVRGYTIRTDARGQIGKVAILDHNAIHHVRVDTFRGYSIALIDALK